MHEPTFFADRLVSVDEINQLLEPFRLLSSALPEGDAFSLKYQNNKTGVTLVTRARLNELLRDINKGRIGSSEEELLKIIDLLSLHANHLDQQVMATEGSPKPGLKEKEQIVLHWMEGAYKVAQQLWPDLDAMINNNDLSLTDHSVKALSCVSQMLHYLGKIRRYQSESKPEERLPLLLAALGIAIHLTDMHQDSPDDLHAYSERTLTFMSPVCITLEQCEKQEAAEKMLKDYLTEARTLQSDFHMIQGAANLSEFYSRNNKHLDLAIQYAESAIKQAEGTKTQPGKGNLSNHPIYFNALRAAMHAYLADGQKDEALCYAKQIAAAHDANPDCGVKPHHLDAVKKVMEQVQSMACSSSM